MNFPNYSRTYYYSGPSFSFSGNDGYIYLCYTPFGIKIGASRKNAKRKLFDANVPFFVKFEYSKKVEYPFKIEKKLHNKFKEKRIEPSAEYFNLNDEDIRWIKENYFEVSNES